jgi:DNA-directed RNA polymerase specialized sigma24 family protein
MTDKDCRQASADAESAASELFQLAALLLADEAAAVEAVEQTLAKVETDPCLEPERARRIAQEQLVQTALTWIQERKNGCLAAVEDDSIGAGGCVDTDDLSAAGLTEAQLQEMLSHSDRAGMRLWLESLAPAQRVIFVLRAVLGRTNVQAVEELLRAGCSGWTESLVGGSFRSALCSLTRSLLHAVAV